jgi:hypothetical protein
MNNMKIIKKGLKPLLAVVVLVGMTTAAYAQADSVDNAGGASRSCQSTWTSYSPLKEESSIVRSNNANHVIHTQSKDVQSGMVLHTFVIKTITSGTEKAFTTYFDAPDSTTYFVDVTDMRLFEDTCYFCGTKVYSYLHPLGGYDKHGIVGRFVIPHMLADTGSILFYEVKETLHLTRLAISRALGSKVLVSAIGDVAYNGTACMVEMTPISIMQWKLLLDTLETPKHAFFTDIMTMRDSIRLLLQYKCNNNYPYGHNNYDNRHQLFMMDRFGLDGCHASYSSSGVYYMAHYDLIADGNFCFHYNKAPMRLCHLNDLDKQFGVAFGVEEMDGSHGGLRLFPFQHAWKYDSCIYYRTNKIVEIKDVGNLYKTATVILLSKDYAHSNGIVTMPELGTATHGVTRLYTSDYIMNSFTQKFVGSHIDISGRDGSSGLHVFDQDVTSLSLPSCFKITTQEYLRLNGQQAARLVAEWVFWGDDDFIWVKLNDVSKSDVIKTTVCEEC